MTYETNRDWTSDLNTKITRSSLLPPRLKQMPDEEFLNSFRKRYDTSMHFVMVDKGCVLRESFTGKGVVCFCKDEMCLAQPPFACEALLQQKLAQAQNKPEEDITFTCEIGRAGFHNISQLHWLGSVR